MSRSQVINIRVSDAEADGLRSAAEALGVSRSRLLRRLIRECLRGYPDYFDDGFQELRVAHRAVAEASRVVRKGQTSPDILADSGVAQLSESIASLKAVLATEITSARERSLAVRDLAT